MRALESTLFLFHSTAKIMMIGWSMTMSLPSKSKLEFVDNDVIRLSDALFQHRINITTTWLLFNERTKCIELGCMRSSTDKCSSKSFSGPFFFLWSKLAMLDTYVFQIEGVLVTCVVNTITLYIYIYLYFFFS